MPYFTPLTPADRVRAAIGMVIVLFSVIILVGTRETLLGDPDIWWHIKTGDWIWLNGQFPTVDPFSYTFAGQPWIAKEWLAQLVYAAAYAMGGWNAVSLLAVLAVAASVALLYRYVSVDLRPNLAGSVVIVCLLLACPTFVVRPHLLTLPLVILWTHELFKSSLQGRAPSYMLLVAMLAWANLHAAFTIGFVIAFFAFLDFLETTRLTKKDQLIKWIVFLALCPAVTLIHPYGYKAMMTTLLVFRSEEGNIPLNEWQPFNAQTSMLYSIALLGLVFAAITSGFRLGFARALLVMLLTYQFLSHMRYAFYLFPVMTLVVVPALARQFPRLSGQRWMEQPLDAVERRASQFFRPVGAVLTAVLLAALGLQLWVLKTSPPEHIAATAAIDYVKSHGVSGNVLNYYDFGGPLIFHGIPTFIDGRTDQLFTNGFQKQVSTVPTDSQTLSNTLAKYDVRWTMLPPDSPFAKLLDKLPGWKRIFTDKSAVIHQRE